MVDAKLTDREIKGMVYSHTGSNPVLTTNSKPASLSAIACILLHSTRDINPKGRERIIKATIRTYVDLTGAIKLIWYLQKNILFLSINKKL